MTGEELMRMYNQLLQISKKNKANMGKDNEQAIHETTQIASIQMKLKSSI